MSSSCFRVLAGVLPSGWGSLQHLEQLDLSNTRWQPQPVGSWPANWGNMSSLRYLHVSESTGYSTTIAGGSNITQGTAGTVRYADLHCLDAEIDRTAGTVRSAIEAQTSSSTSDACTECDHAAMSHPKHADYLPPAWLRILNPLALYTGMNLTHFTCRKCKWSAALSSAYAGQVHLKWLDVSFNPPPTDRLGANLDVYLPSSLETLGLEVLKVSLSACSSWFQTLQCVPMLQL